MNSQSQRRRERILTAMRERKHVSARDVALTLGVSEATARRDLKLLHDERLVELVYGGATLRQQSDYSFSSKSQRQVAAKRAVGRLAAELVADHDHIFLDSGTTAFEIAPFLESRRGVTVIVNSARLALELDRPGLRVLLLGGSYRPDRMDTVGPLATNALDQLRGYKAFIGADGLHPEFGLAAADIESAELYRRAVAHAGETILVADSSKFAAPSLYKIVDWEQVQKVVTDVKPNAEWMEFFSARGIETIYETANTPQEK